jgi:hypothetical protein
MAKIGVRVQRVDTLYIPACRWEAALPGGEPGNIMGRIAAIPLGGHGGQEAHVWLTKKSWTHSSLK